MIMTFIPEKQYAEIVQLIPIACVDVAILRCGKLLMIQRETSETWGGLWWITGGRIHKGETWHDAAKRKAQEEAGLDVEIVRKVQSYESPETEGKHFITTLFVAVVVGDATVTLDKTSSDYKWMTEMDGNWHPLLKQMLCDAEVFGV